MASVEQEYPRLSRFLRAFSGLDRPKSIKRQRSTLEQYRKWRAEQLKNGLSWSDVCEFLENEVGPKSVVMKELRHLRSIAVEMCGNDQGKDVVDEAAIFLLKLFLQEQHVMQKHMLMLKQMFGSVSQHLAAKAHKSVCSIASCMPESCAEYIKNGSNGIVDIPTVQFGEHLVIAPVRRQVYQPDTNFLHDLSVELGSEVLKEFTMKYDDSAALAQAKEEPRKNQSKRNGYGRSWLEKELRKHPSGLSVDQLTDNVINMLKSGRSSDELQNELFDLLGFDQFELIQSLLEHRRDVIHSVSAGEEKRLTNSSQAILEQRRPNFGCQVIVQSEQEKQMLKQALKEEKRIMKNTTRGDEDSDEEPPITAADVKAKNFREPVGKSKAAPNLRDKLRPAQTREVYPHVYDAQHQAQQKTGFISGVRMMLPEGVNRVDTKMYEEVNIPVSPPPPLDVGNKLIAIDSLDKDGCVKRKEACQNGGEEAREQVNSVWESRYYVEELEGAVGGRENDYILRRMRQAWKNDRNSTIAAKMNECFILGQEVARRVALLSDDHAFGEVKRLIYKLLTEAEAGKYDKPLRPVLAVPSFKGPNPPPYSTYHLSKVSNIQPRRSVSRF